MGYAVYASTGPAITMPVVLIIGQYFIDSCIVNAHDPAWENLPD